MNVETACVNSDLYCTKDWNNKKKRLKTDAECRYQIEIRGLYIKGNVTQTGV